MHQKSILERLGGHLERLGGVLGSLGGVLGRLRGVLGHLETVRGRLGVVLSRLGDVLEASWRHLQAMMAPRPPQERQTLRLPINWTAKTRWVTQASAEASWAL